MSNCKDIPVKILVVGDSGVGKTHLSSILTDVSDSMKSAQCKWTIGANVEILIHKYKQGTPEEDLYFCELWDVSGNLAHTTSRSVFFNNFHGVIFVHNLTNRKSLENIRGWSEEVLDGFRKTMKLISALFALAVPALAHDYNANVVEVTNDNFKAEVKEGKWLVKFFAPWCGHCKRLKPTWDELADAQTGVKIGAVDCTKHKDVCGEHGVRGYPTLLFFPDGSLEGEKYASGRDLESFKTFCESK